MISPLLPEHHRQGREHALVFSVEASLNFLSRPDVELLFLDAPKRVRDISKVLTLFGKYVIPVITKMLWQDFIHFPSFEIAACLYRLSDYIEPIYISEPGTTIVFLVHKKWEEKDVSVQNLALENWNSDEISAAWDDWLAVIGDPGSQFRFGSAMFLHDIGMIEHACAKIGFHWVADPYGTENAWKKFRKTHLKKRYQPVRRRLDRRDRATT